MEVRTDSELCVGLHSINPKIYSSLSVTEITPNPIIPGSSFVSIQATSLRGTNFVVRVTNKSEVKDLAIGYHRTS